MNQQERREGQLTPIGALIERNIELATKDPIARGGFTQVPNFILEDSALSLGAKVTYSLFLHFAWHKDSVFPGQDRLAAHMGMSTSRANEYIKELEAAGSSRSPGAARARPTLQAAFRREAAAPAGKSEILISIYRNLEFGRSKTRVRLAKMFY